MRLWPNFLAGSFPGRTMLRPACGLALVAAVAGCVGQLPLEEMPAPVTATAHQAVDWSRAKPVRIMMTEFIFVAGEPNFKKGVPYRLELRNTGEEAHMFDARAFFRSIAVRDVEIVKTASIGGLLDPDRAWKPAAERLPDVGPEEEDEAEGKNGKAGKGDKAKPAKKGKKAAGKAQDGSALSLKIDDDDLDEDEDEAEAAETKDGGDALKIDDDDLDADEADEAAKDDDALALKIKEEDEDTLKIDDEGEGEDHDQDQDTLKIDNNDEDGEEADEGAGGDDVALKDDEDEGEDDSDDAAKDDAETLKVDDDDDEAEAGTKDDDALVLKTDDDEDEAEAGTKDDDALVLETDEDEAEADKSEAGGGKDQSEARQAGGTQVAKAAPVIKLPSQGAFDEDDDLTFERTPSQASDLRPVAKDEDEKGDAEATDEGEEGDEAKQGKADAKRPPEPWTAITVEYVVVPPGHSAFVSFVPVREGVYWLSSGNPVFLTQGMFDRLIIE